MDNAAQERWRAALELKGKNRVQAELELNPGHPSDLVFDVGTEPPYPTRAFCERWCNGGTGKPVGFAGYGFVVIALAVLVFICVGRAITSYTPAPDPRMPQPMASAPAGGGGGASSGVSSSLAGGNSAVLANGSVVNTSEPQSLSAACSAVNNPTNTASVRRLPPCSKLGTQTSTQPGSASGGASNSGH